MSIAKSVRPKREGNIIEINYTNIVIFSVKSVLSISFFGFYNKNNK